MAIALLGLVCVGVASLGFFIFLQFGQPDPVVNLPSPTIIVPIETPTTTSTPSATHTPTPLPTPTGTSVVKQDAQEVSTTQTDEAALESTVVVTGTVATEVPQEEGQEDTPTSEPTATPTDALALPTAADPGEATATGTAVVTTPTLESDTYTATPKPGEMPDSGGILTSNNSYLIWVGLVVLLILAAGTVSYARSSRA